MFDDARCETERRIISREKPIIYFKWGVKYGYKNAG